MNCFVIYPFKANRIVLALIFLLVVILTPSCVSGPKTASGRPEISVAILQPREIRDRIVNRYSAAGWMIEKADEYSLVFAHRSENVLHSLVAGTQYNPDVYWRARFTITNSGGLSHVYGFIESVSNYGSAFERRNDCSTAKAGAGVQETLESLFGQPTSPSGSTNK